MATLWTWFIASANHVHLSHLVLPAMFLAVWILYAADRLLDARNLAIPAALSERGPGDHRTLPRGIEERHLFHYRHRKFFRYAIAMASLALSLLVPGFPPDSLHCYLVLSGVLVGYFVLVHVNGDRGRPCQPDRVPKELAVGIFFSAATFIPTIASHPDLRLTVLAQAFLLAPLLIINCLFIYAWEHPGICSRTHPVTLIAIRVLPVLAAVGVFANLAIATLALALDISLPRHILPWQLPMACAAAYLLLLICDRCRLKLAPTTLRAAADFCLLTPIMVLPLLRGS